MRDIVRYHGEMFSLGFQEVLLAKNFRIVEIAKLEQLTGLVQRRDVDILLGAEYIALTDNLHFRHAGFTDVLLRKAREKNIAIGFSFSDFLRCKDDYERARIFGRMQQNVRLCRKCGVNVVVASFARTKWEMRGALDLLAFARVLGMTGDEARNALTFAPKR